MKNPEWPFGSIKLLSKVVNNKATGEDYVNWAVRALVDGFESPSLAILAGLDVGGTISRFEADKYFQKSVQEMGLSLPDDESVLRKFAVEIAVQIRDGIIDPETGIEFIHREVVCPLGHPSDLQSWCFLWEGLFPDGTGILPEEERLSSIVEYAKTWLSELGVE